MLAEVGKRGIADVRGVGMRINLPLRLWRYGGVLVGCRGGCRRGGCNVNVSGRGRWRYCDAGRKDGRDLI